MLDGAPVAVTEPVWLEAAQGKAGVHATVVCDWCQRTVTTVGGPLDPAPCTGLAAACRASNPSAVGKARNVEDVIG
ncbi:hypothetical protein SAMN05216532_8144 [Streptomyces sp. 2231.1]|uniref:hypothetical protein n=1 Tax=Streptomyces sp. 2231.1 TaxID=1855347 RepID=UPI0008996FB4|nr:hypothetical protein [Streptomyces sp. 2231.1]SEE41086.1 hypothetical protein SAMN05216532_8144 [Streptomyces sp. 2231.1]